MGLILGLLCYFATHIHCKCRGGEALPRSCIAKARYQLPSAGIKSQCSSSTSACSTIVVLVLELTYDSALVQPLEPHLWEPCILPLARVRWPSFLLDVLTHKRDLWRVALLVTRGVEDRGRLYALGNLAGIVKVHHSGRHTVSTFPLLSYE